MWKKMDTWMKVSRGYDSMLREAAETINLVREIGPDYVILEAAEFIGCAFRVQVSASPKGIELLQKSDREWEESRGFVRQNTR